MTLHTLSARRLWALTGPRNTTHNIQAAGKELMRRTPKTVQCDTCFAVQSQLRCVSCARRHPV